MADSTQSWQGSGDEGRQRSSGEPRRSASDSRSESANSQPRSLEDTQSFVHGSARQDDGLDVSQASLADASAAAARVPSDQQKTVISKFPKPSPSPPSRRRHPEDLGEELEGQTLGNIDLQEFVGGGGMGAVFRGVDRSLERTVAVKVISRDHNEEDTLRRFRNEAQSAARLDHPNIARVHYVGEDQGWHYIVFEFIEGVNVRELVEHRGPLSVEDAISYTIQVASALQHASQRDVIHRDIKPSNILIMEDGRAKLVDMGLARFEEVDKTANEITASGVTLGTFDYISPEQARDPRNADVRSDLYSLGCTLYYMLTASAPFPEGTVLQKLLSHSSESPPDPRDFRADIPDELVASLFKLLAKSPAQRFQQPNDLIRDLYRTVAKYRLRIGTETPVQLVNEQPRIWTRYIPWLAPWVLLTLIASGFEYLSAFGTAEYPRPQLSEGIYRVPVPPADAAAGAVDDPGSPDSSASRKLEGLSENRPRSGEVSPATPPVVVEQAGDAAPEVERAPVTNEPERESMPQSTPTEIFVVGSDDPRVDRREYFNSLKQAILLAESEPSVQRVVLDLDGPVHLDHLDIRLADRENQPLTLAAATARVPVIVFKPSEGTWQRSGFIHVFGGELRWEGVHFWLELAPELPEREQWSLISIDGCRRFDLVQGSVTIRNVLAGVAPKRWADAHSEVVMLDIAATKARRLGDSGEARPLAITLEDFMMRGQASVLRANEAETFNLQWTRGLIACSRRFVELTAGMLGDTAIQNNFSTIALTDVLLNAAEGLCRVDHNPAFASSLGLWVRINNSLIATRLDPEVEVPLFEFRGIDDLETQQLLIDGQENDFLNTSTVLSLASEAGAASEIYRFEDLWNSNSRWFLQRVPPILREDWRPPYGPVDQRSRSDYVEAARNYRVVTRLLATSFSQLPEFPNLELSSPEPVDAAVQ